MEIPQIPSLIQEKLAEEEKRAQYLRDQAEKKQIARQVWHNGRGLLDQVGAEWQNTNDLFKEERQHRFHKEPLMVGDRTFGVIIREHRERFLRRLTGVDIEVGLAMRGERFGVDIHFQDTIYQSSTRSTLLSEERRFVESPTIKQARQYRELLFAVMSQRGLEPNLLVSKTISSEAIST